MTQQSNITGGGEYELRFESLFVPGRALSFVCDRQGRVDLDSATGRLRNNYLFARAMVGRDFSPPVVRAVC
jgi:hypothetical protein